MQSFYSGREAENPASSRTNVISISASAVSFSQETKKAAQGLTLGQTTSRAKFNVNKQTPTANNLRQNITTISARDGETP